jgi:hypothetical protein
MSKIILQNSFTVENNIILKVLFNSDNEIKKTEGGIFKYFNIYKSSPYHGIYNKIYNNNYLSLYGKKDYNESKITPDIKNNIICVSRGGLGFPML